jgi:fluoride exporter
MTALLVALGAAVGAPLRYLTGRALDARFPWGTLTVNLLGSALLGALVGAAVDGHALALLGTGFCGGLTTYSTFAVQSVQGGRRRGTAYAVVTRRGDRHGLSGRRDPGAPGRRRPVLVWPRSLG